MNHFVTLFDKNYLSRGVALIESLQRVSEQEIKLSVLAIDKSVEHFFASGKYEGVSIITVNDMISYFPELEKIRKERSVGEFCWTLSSYSIKYVLEKYNPDNCIYVDSDLFFYSNPQRLIDQMGDKSVLITEHNYYHKYDLSEYSGKFCVQFMCFRNDDKGKSVLEWWRAKCEEWCFNRMEDGKFGDQKYLDDWESRFSDVVYNCKDIGCGVAPWNCEKYNLLNEESKYFIKEKITKLISPLCFIHFHGITRLINDTWIIPDNFDTNFKEICKSYIMTVLNIEKELKEPELKWKELPTDPFIRKHKFSYAMKMGFNEFKRIIREKREYTIIEGK